MFSRNNRSVKEFQSNLYKVNDIDYNDIIESPKLVEALIPNSIEEYFEFYSLSYSEKTLSLYRKIDMAIIELATRNKGNCTYLYFNMAEYVDGEYAQKFFDNIDSLIEKNKTTFCKFFSNLRKGSQERLESKRSKFCN